MIAGEFRKGPGISQAEVARRLSWIQSAVAFVEQSDVMELDLLLLGQYANALGGRIEVVLPALTVGGPERRVRL